ncbi:hypothetical protein EVAR_53377_1 [Eumeta japonica]|uniref:Uncharacterized protein n=1 Tax=Eumeta variegata TaxID=151549 RepID=A0A4C1Y995_EUMVA|nr:hypothetical protein EVAR_53377_1 [Eumeta japonica]
MSPRADPAKAAARRAEPARKRELELGPGSLISPRLLPRDDTPSLIRTYYLKKLNAFADFRVLEVNELGRWRSNGE